MDLGLTYLSPCGQEEVFPEEENVDRAFPVYARCPVYSQKRIQCIVCKCLCFNLFFWNVMQIFVCQEGACTLHVWLQEKGGGLRGRTSSCTKQLRKGRAVA